MDTTTFNARFSNQTVAQIIQEMPEIAARVDEDTFVEVCALGQLIAWQLDRDMITEQQARHCFLHIWTQKNMGKV